MGTDCEESGSSEVNIGDSYPITSSIGAEDGYMQVLSVNSDSVEIEASLPLVVAGDINAGESLMVPVDFPTQVSIRLDDISIYPTNEPPSALLSIISDDIVVGYMDLPEGTAKAPSIFENLITVGAPVVSPGYTFGAIRVELELFYCGPL